MLSTMFKLYKELEVYLHYAHLKTNSFAQHKALGKAYDTIGELNDQLAENLYRVKEDLMVPGTLTINTEMDKSDITEYLRRMVNETNMYVQNYNSQLEIQDILLGYLQCFNKTLYLLTLN